MFSFVGANKTLTQFLIFFGSKNPLLIGNCLYEEQNSNLYFVYLYDILSSTKVFHETFPGRSL